jgi:hypothetical protein
MAVDGILGRALRDPATGLPNVPYFCLIRDWEERRARRRQYAVRVLKVSVSGGSERVRRSLSWRLCQELRSSDLIASEGGEHYRILLTSPDAENVESIRARLQSLAAEINERDPDEETFRVDVEVDAERRASARDAGPCVACEEDALDD